MYIIVKRNYLHPFIESWSHKHVLCPDKYDYYSLSYLPITAVSGDMLHQPKRVIHILFKMFYDENIEGEIRCGKGIQCGRG